MRSQSRSVRYAVAALAVGLSIALLFVPGLGPSLAGGLCLAVLVSAWYGGLGPGLATTFGILGVVLALHGYAHHVPAMSEVVSLSIFVLIGVLIAGLVQSMHRAWRRDERSERWTSAVLKSIGDAVIATDASGRILFMNPVAEVLTGWTEARAKGLALGEVFSVVDEQTGAPMESPVTQILGSGGVGRLPKHAILISHNGRELAIDENAAPIVDELGAISGVVLVFRDATEVRRIEELRERLAAIVESSDDAIVSKDLEGVITSWNAGAERIFGYSAEEVIGRHVSTIVPPDLAEDVPRILERIRRGERIEHFETKRRRKDGTMIDVSITVSAIRDATGRVIGASKTGRDITERKRIEQERVEADRQKDEFLAMLAHELRNPLASINNAARLLGSLRSEDDLEWAKSVVLRQVRHLARLIEDLLDVSRLTRGAITLRLEVVDLAPIVQSAVESVRPLLEERKHTLEVELADGPLRLQADPVRLEQILVNLLTNAAKYTPSGGKIRLEARRDADDLIIAVNDTGMGITPELQRRMFDLFAQGDRSAARSEGGLGIGLTLVKRLSELHGGSVAGTSEGPGKGSEFKVRLPATDARLPETHQPTPGEPTFARKSSRVLVVDDNADTARGLAKLLRLLGNEVRVEHDGASAIEAAKVHRPDVILLDIGLPGMNGYEVAKRLREDAVCENALIIAVSGYGHDEDRRQSQRAGFNHHLVKPLDYDALMALMAAAN